MNNVSIFSHDEVTHDLTAVHFSSNYNKSVIWVDTDIRLVVKTTAQSVIWADTDIRLVVKTTAQSVIWVDTDIRPVVKTTAQSVIWADTDIRLVVKTTAQSVRTCNLCTCPSPLPVRWLIRINNMSPCCSPPSRQDRPWWLIRINKMLPFCSPPSRQALVAH